MTAGDHLDSAIAEVLGSDALVDPAGYTRNGVTPAVAVRPAGEAQMAEVLRLARAEGRTVTPWGAGSKQHRWPALASYDIALDLTRFDAIEDFEPANLSVICGAGIRLPALNARLAEQALFFPVAPPDYERATAGGTVMTGSSGSTRLRYRTPRDWLVGAHVVFPDGSSTRFGGKLMKNVAGYDLNKLLPGSWGTLLVATQLILRLLPLPEQRTSLLIAGPRADLLVLVERVQQSRHQPAAVDAVLDAPTDATRRPLPTEPPFMLIACEDVAEAVERQVRELSELAAGLKLDVARLDGDAQRSAWQSLDALQAGEPEQAQCRFKLSIPPSRVPDLGRRLDGIARLTLASHVCVGVSYAILDLEGVEDERAREVAETLRETAAALGGFAILQSAPHPLHPALGRWPPRSDYGLMRALKRELDPSGMLSPGRTVGNS